MARLTQQCPFKCTYRIGDLLKLCPFFGCHQWPVHPLVIKAFFSGMLSFVMPLIVIVILVKFYHLDVAPNKGRCISSISILVALPIGFFAIDRTFSFSFHAYCCLSRIDSWFYTQCTPLILFVG